jgi:hypothetical protein
MTTRERMERPWQWVRRRWTSGFIACSCRAVELGSRGRGPGRLARQRRMLPLTFWESGIWNLESGIMSMLGGDRNRIEPLARVRLDASEAPWASAAASSPDRPISHPSPALLSAWVPRTGTPTRIQQRCSRERPRLRPGPWPLALPWASPPTALSAPRRSRHLAHSPTAWGGMGHDIRPWSTPCNL